MQRIRSGTAIATLTALTLGLATAGANAASSNKNLVLIQGTKADNFYVTMGCGAEAEAKKLGYKISVQGPTEFAPSEQIPIVHSVTATKPAAVLIAPTDEHALIAPMQAMKSAGHQGDPGRHARRQQLDRLGVDLVEQHEGRRGCSRRAGEADS